MFADLEKLELDCSFSEVDEELELDDELEVELSAVRSSLCADFEKSDVDCSL